MRAERREESGSGGSDDGVEEMDSTKERSADEGTSNEGNSDEENEDNNQ
jgi:hypothetical protein